MSDLFIPGQTIGIIGGGHLARMLTIAAKSIGFQVGILDPKQGCSAAQIADWQIVADFNNEEAFIKMAEKCDVLTYERENVDIETLEKINGLVSIPQGNDPLSFSQDLLLEKAFLETSNINIAPYTTIVQISDIQGSVDAIGFPCVLKSTNNRLGENSQHVMHSLTDIKGCVPLVTSGTCILEAMIPYDKAISVMVVGNGSGEYKTFPIVENVYEKSTLVHTIAPAELPKIVKKEALRIAESIAITLSLQGVLNIEMFVTEEGMLYVNTLSPRPHNSGHYTIDACNLSQFEAHIRGICGWPIPDIELYSPAIMLNIIGDQVVKSINEIPYQENWFYHYYGKKRVKDRRKMGHITVLTDNIEASFREVKNSHIWSD